MDPRLLHLDHLGPNAYVGIGVGLSSFQNAKMDGVVVRVDVCSDLSKYENPTDTELKAPNGASDCAKDYTWVWASSETSVHDNFGWVTASPDKSYILAAGVKERSGGKMARWIVKLDAATGSKIWEIVMPTNDGMGGKSGYETVEFTADGGFVVGGWANSDSGEFPSFKSGGQVDTGKPMFQKFSSSVAAQTTAFSNPPTPDWSFKCGSGNCDNLIKGSVKGMRVFMDGGVEKVVGAVGDSAALLVVNIADGSQALYKEFVADNYSFMDVEPVFENGQVTGYGVTGLESSTAAKGTQSCIANDGCGIIKGHLSMVKADFTGSMFNTEFNDFTGGTGSYAGLTPLSDAIVLTECWGLTSTMDAAGTTTTGLVAACGQGIEGCKEYLKGISNSALDKCEKDPRRTWRGAAVKTDLSGNILWWRNDNHRAYEFVDRGDDGSLVFLSDKPIGFGFATMAKET